MKKGSHRRIVVGSVLSLVLALLLALGVVSVSLGKSHPMVGHALLLVSRVFGFSATDSPLGLVPLIALLFVWSGMGFAFRGKRRFSFILLPLTALMFYTLMILSHMLQQSPRPHFLQSFLYAAGSDPRSASLRVVVAFLAETILFVAFTLIGDALDRQFQKKQAFQKKLAMATEGKSVDMQGMTRLQRRRFKKEQKRREKAERSTLDEEENIVLTKKQVAPEVDILSDEKLTFPPIAEIPELGSLKRKREKKVVVEDAVIIESETQPALGVVSIGALEAIKEERERNNGVSYLEMKQRELQEKRAAQQAEQKPAEPKPEMPEKKHMAKLSGFLQGALEAVGKGPSQAVEPKAEPTGKATGMLAEAVAHKQQSKGLEAVALGVRIPQQQDDDEQPLQVRERILSVRPPVQAKVEVPVEEAPPVKEPEQGISPFAPQSTARPINGGFSEDAPVAEVVVTNEEDELEVASGVGGLTNNCGSGSALINKGKLSYQFPPESILVTYPKIGNEVDEESLERGKTLVATLEQFNVHVELTNIVRGPTVTMFEILPAPGIRVNSIVNLADNIALALAAKQVRIVAPIPGKSAVGIEIPNLKRDIIGFKEMISSIDDKQYHIPMVLGRNLMGEPIVMDVNKAPHLLIAGSTGSGKSVCVNSMICSLLFRKSPKEIRLILVDPKIVELSIYNGIPHLLTPVIHDPKKTLKAFDFCLYEMDRRYRLLQGINARNIEGYNGKIVEDRLAREKLPYIVIVIDEFADLMHTVGKELENKVSRLAAMSRAVGIHLVLATQRPSVDVITGVIKSNIPTRIAFAVTSTTDSRIIIDEGGAEKLLGKGDMLFVASSDPTAERIQGAFLSDKEVEQVVRFVSKQGVPDFIDDSFFEDEEPASSDNGSDYADGTDDDQLMERALEIVVERKSASASYLQRRLKIGYNRAARLVEQMEEMGYVGPPNGSKPRELLRYP
ncbi:DNA translocase FtsK [Sphaerochaeta sp. PS]|uniref:DNA translocase FtsK n=1 Tax=Sphaerochaeta sp. PS TaxID=3076336 RepID=UPI0028A48681|nr:DNA translocase FtsK [Sphaerochaeta sp. PS]MDT4761919.1 DNA translocase FtsK [Sphaerochaeta sp. PS]